MAVRVVLRGLALLFSQMTELRALMYRNRLFRHHRLPYPVISVGNLSVGGTGKTPIVAYIAERLIELGYRPYILSRGYKGSVEDSIEIVSDGQRILSTPDRCGDEPFLLAQCVPEARIVVGSRRWKAARAITDPGKQTLYLLDDGFQHLQLARDLNLLVIDATRPPWNDAPLPAGKLREPLAAIARADAIILSRSHHLSSEQLSEMTSRLNRIVPGTPVFTFSHQARELFDIRTKIPAPVELLRRQHWVVLAAIGNPEQFLLDIEKAQGQIVGQCLYRDHHRFTQQDLARVASICRNSRADAVLTTEKDAVRLDLPDDFPCPVYTLRIQAQSHSSTNFDKWLSAWLQELDRQDYKQEDHCAPPVNSKEVKRNGMPSKRECKP